MSSLLSAVDELYASCVTEPERWGDTAFADWVESVASADGVDRDIARSLRRVVAAARRLVTFWSAPDVPSIEGWRSRVDVAAGPRAWRPQLELAQELLDRHPDEETFGYVARLFPVVVNQPFLDGVDYDTWLEGRAES